MRIAVVSDSHGHLRLVQDLARRHDVDAVIHCGDFGFFSERHTKGIPDRELALLISHSSLPKTERKKVWDLSYEEKLTIVLEHGLMGEFDVYLAGDETFDVPVYVVPGNHDDHRVVQDLLSGEMTIPNLHVITPDADLVLDGWIRLMGVGGNMSIHSFLNMSKKQSFHLRTTFKHWVQLYQNLKRLRHDTEQVWMVTHVSPGKQPILELLSLHLNPALWFSGHMGIPMPQHYSLKTVYEARQFVRRVTPSIEFLRRAWEDLMQRRGSKQLTELEDYLFLLDLPEKMKNLSEEEFPMREPKHLSRLMSGTFFFNLPDADRGGYFIITTREGKRAVDIEIKGSIYL